MHVCSMQELLLHIAQNVSKYNNQTMVVMPKETIETL
jgi:hypothetical protein